MIASMRAFLPAVCLFATLAGAAAPASTASSFDPLRKGAGEVRAKLNAMERKPFDWALVSALSDWKNGSAPTAQSTDGKVVLFVTYSDWYRPAARAFTVAQKAAEKFAKDGLVVVAIHNAEGWKDAPKPAAPAGSTMLLCVDAKGDFRKGLLSNQDPNFYLVDRAGQLRYANVANESVDEAIQFLISESRDAASTLNQREADAEKARRMEEARTGALNNKDDLLRNLPELPFTAPKEQAYKDAKWPALPEDKNNSSNKAEPKKIALPSGAWVPSQPALAGRAVVVYFWNPGVTASYEQMQVAADFMQRQHQRDLVVVGVLTDLQALGQNVNFDRMTDEEKAKKQLTPESALQKAKDFQAARKYDHAMVVDMSGAVLKSVTGENSIPLPFLAVISSDGYARWWGFAGSPEAKGALDRVLEVDPGVQARRKAEADYLKANTAKADAASEKK